MKTNPFLPVAGFIDLLLDAVCVVDADGQFVYVSAACERIFGYSPEEMVGKVMIDMVAPDDRERTLAAARDIMGGRPSLHFENRYVHKDGRIVHIMWTARWSETDRLRIAVARDITERKQAEAMQAAVYAISEAAHAAEDLAALLRLIHRIIGTLLPAPGFCVAMTDARGGPLSFPYRADEEASERFRHIAATLSTEIIHTEQSLLRAPSAAAVDDGASPRDGCVVGWLGVPLKSSKGTIGALLLNNREGSPGYTEQDRELLHFVSTQVATAVERKQLQAHLQYMAQYDGLTGLPNRGLLNDRLGMALARSQRDDGQVAVLYIDLDGFKQVNDTFGHAGGDLLLQEVANRLKRCVRGEDTVARMGGDEFVVVLVDIRQPEHASNVAALIRGAISEPIHIDGHDLCVVPSIGIALYPEHGQDARYLLSRADEAMYAVKKSANG